MILYDLDLKSKLYFYPIFKRIVPLDSYHEKIYYITDGQKNRFFDHQISHPNVRVRNSFLK